MTLEASTVSRTPAPVQPIARGLVSGNPVHRVPANLYWPGLRLSKTRISCPSPPRRRRKDRDVRATCSVHHVGVPSRLGPSYAKLVLGA